MAAEKSNDVEAPKMVRVRYLGDKHIEHSMSGKAFNQFVMHELTQEEFTNLQLSALGEPFEEIK